MSRRTSEANKAIAQAWDNEKQLVKEGKGTRDWTEQQQRDILERGKAYDDNGKAFEGQHMRSAEKYPEYQGDPQNIQFLTREEHLEAHDGSWKNPTNWYYDPVTKMKMDFGDGPVIACKEIKLSNPLPISGKLNENKEIKEEKKQESNVNNKPTDSRLESLPEHNVSFNLNSDLTTSKPGFIKRGWNWVKIHWKEIVFGAGAVGAAATAIAVAHKSKSTKSDSDRIFLKNDMEDNDYLPNLPQKDYLEENSECDYPDERLSPRQHDVSGYTRYMNGKEIHVNPYKRGGKKDDE